MTIILDRAITAAWTRDRYCRVLAGVYQREAPGHDPVRVPEQVGRVVGWYYLEWDGATPTAVRLNVAVTNTTEL